MSPHPDCRFMTPLAGRDGVDIVSLSAAERSGLPIRGLPRSLRIMAEGLLAHLPPDDAAREIRNLAARDKAVSFIPGRALLQDFLGIPLMTDMASMRDALAAAGHDPSILNPRIPVDFVVDHSLVVHHFGSADALAMNRSEEFSRNRERFAFIKWCKNAFDNVRIVPPGSGIMHQVNLEWLAHIVSLHRLPGGRSLALSDTMIGTDSHTTMVNGLSVLGWGVGGIEAETAMLGVPVTMAAPRVVGLTLTGALPTGATATDLVLHLTEFLRGVGVVDAFVEFEGPGLVGLSVTDRATIANMAPEYGATCAYFPIDDKTLDYLRMTGRSGDHIDLVERYATEQGLWQSPGTAGDIDFDRTYHFDLSRVEPSLAGPTRPQDRVGLADVPVSLQKRARDLGKADLAPASDDGLENGAVVIAAITSCTNTANPPLMIAAGLLAKNAVERGLRTAPHVKTSLSPGSRAVTAYLEKAGLQIYLDQLGFQTIGYGCATCNGNSGPLSDEISRDIDTRGVVAAAVLSGNRNFEGRINPLAKAAYLASPPLVVCYAIAGTVSRDLTREPVGWDASGAPVHLHEIWPSDEEIAVCVSQAVESRQFSTLYDDDRAGNGDWKRLPAPSTMLFPWDAGSTFIGPSPFPAFDREPGHFGRLCDLRPLLILGDSVTTDHISPNAAIRRGSPAAEFLSKAGVDPLRFGNYGARRGNVDVCARGMFDNPLLRNEMLPGSFGNRTIRHPEGQVCSVYEAGDSYRRAGTGALIIAGREYGAGSSRDFAAKGLRLLGVEAVLAESFERIHRANLAGAGVLPLAFAKGQTRQSLGLDGEHVFDLSLSDELAPGSSVQIVARHPRHDSVSFRAVADLRTSAEVEILEAGGILPWILARLKRAC